ncbi:unnamed protein product [Darwinula stevensoni]|uniref:Uncharacterized protein n=1 Tax=Darwinula stevensoni TaxID=69355 RepID=A0A7R8XDG4_9CRUS|nr:unnamed protein product [Darwinula stevensoni]CAG0894307.1 unnamed protein product [Darwinula stevensoni]
MPMFGSQQGSRPGRPRARSFLFDDLADDIWDFDDAWFSRHRKTNRLFDFGDLLWEFLRVQSLLDYLLGQRCSRSRFRPEDPPQQQPRRHHSHYHRRPGRRDEGRRDSTHSYRIPSPDPKHDRSRRWKDLEEEMKKILRDRFTEEWTSDYASDEEDRDRPRYRSSMTFTRFTPKKDQGSPFTHKTRKEKDQDQEVPTGTESIRKPQSEYQRPSARKYEEETKTKYQHEPWKYRGPDTRKDDEEAKTKYQYEPWKYRGPVTRKDDEETRRKYPGPGTRKDDEDTKTKYQHEPWKYPGPGTRKDDEETRTKYPGPGTRKNDKETKCQYDPLKYNKSGTRKNEEETKSKEEPLSAKCDGGPRASTGTKYYRPSGGTKMYHHIFNGPGESTRVVYHTIIREDSADATAKKDREPDVVITEITDEEAEEILREERAKKHREEKKENEEKEKRDKWPIHCPICTDMADPSDQMKLFCGHTFHSRVGTSVVRPPS